MSDIEDESIREITQSIKNMIDQITDSVAQVDNLENADKVEGEDVEGMGQENLETSESVENQTVENSDTQKAEPVPVSETPVPIPPPPPVLTEKEKKEREVQLNKDMDANYAIQKYLMRKRHS